MRAPLVLALTAAAFAAGIALGNQVVARQPVVSRAEHEATLRQRDEAQAEAANLARQVQALQRSRAVAPPAATETRPNGDAAAPVAPAPRAGTAGPADTSSVPADPAARRRRVEELTAGIDAMFESADGDAALSTLRDLADLAPEGREAAMALAIRINDDVRGAGALGVDVYRFYQHLGDTGIRDLMKWSLAGNPSPPGFRVMSAFSLPWVLPREQAIEALSSSLREEKDLSVQVAVVGNLTQMNDRRSDAVLSAMFADRERDPMLRAQVATAIALTADAPTVRLLEAAATDDPDERVRAASRAALIARDPPADGYLVTWVVPDGKAAAAGVRIGDILLRYDGVAIGNVQELQSRIRAAESREQVEVVFLHDGRETTSSCRGGALGVQGRPVRRK